MQTIGNPSGLPTRPNRQFASKVALSTSAHLAVLLLATAALHRKPAWIAPYRLPGSPNGHNFMVTYLPDRAPAQTAATSKAAAKAEETVTPVPAKPRPAFKERTLASETTPPSPEPNSTSGADALGSGNITIALNSYFPPPRPDLSALPRGTHGDVILRIVIDTTGKITDLTMTSGLGYGIDDSVIATVKEWTFHPAMQNGHPVVSEQELHFHYEKG